MKMENFLYFIDSNGHLMYSTLLSEGMIGTGMGTFFILNNTLWFIKNKSELNIINLN